METPKITIGPYYRPLDTYVLPCGVEHLTERYFCQDHCTWGNKSHTYKKNPIKVFFLSIKKKPPCRSAWVQEMAFSVVLHASQCSL